MLKQQDMTETAKVVFNELSIEPATVGEIAQNTYLSRERCQLILTQLVMAGWQITSSAVTDAFSNEGLLICENGRLVGVGSTCQPFAHAYWSQANHGPLL